MRRRHHHRHHLALPCVFPFLLLLAAAGGSQAKPKNPNGSAVSPVAAAAFVRRCCTSTSYPRVCESTLLPRAPAVGRSPRRLARAALAVGADRAGNWSSYLLLQRGRAGPGAGHGDGDGAMRDCAEMARDAAEQLRRAAAELAARMGRAGSPRFAWRLSNVQTWASAALTDTDTCLDSLDDGKSGGGDSREKDAVRRRTVAVAQATSNALALVNRLDPAPHHRL